MFDVNKIREDFPILEEKVYGHKLVYFDNGATSQRPLSVVEEMDKYYLKYNANVHRGVHYLSGKCTDANEMAREKIKTFINAASSKEIIFTRGTTESINLVAYSFGQTFIKKGDVIVVSEMEHHADIVPWQLLCERSGAVLKIIPFSDNGELVLSDIDSIITTGVKLVCLTYVSNVLGTINDVKLLIDKAHKCGASVLIDGAQAVPHMHIDVQALDCDFFVFSGHKMYGPTGVGVLYGKQPLLEAMSPWQGGGEMISEVTFAKTSFNEIPFKFEAGTPDFIGIIGLGKAIDYINSIGMENISSHEDMLTKYAMSEFQKVEGLRIFGTSACKAGVISFLVEGIHHFDMGTMLDQYGIAVRTGHHCAQPIMTHYGVTGMVRVSFGMYNTIDEIDYFIGALKKIIKMFKA